MPQVITSQEEIERVVRELDLTAQLFEKQGERLKYGPDLEVIVRGRTPENGKKIGPYVRLLSYQPEEEIVRQGEWGGNIFYISTTGLLDVYVTDQAGSKRKVGELRPGTCFGEMSVLAGVERNATVAVPTGGEAVVLEVMRPALRLLRKLPTFGQALDATYRTHALNNALEELAQVVPAPANEELIEHLRQTCRVMIYGKHHVLCQEDTPADKLILIRSGWVRRVRGIPFNAAEKGISVGVDKGIGVDFLGAGNCLGLEGVGHPSNWKYSASVIARTEVLEVPFDVLSSNPLFRDQLVSSFSRFSSADDKLPPTIDAVSDSRVLAATEEEISTGIVDGVNLLVMDMDLCVRCGNCSLACHKVHGQSRLLRRGITITRPVSIGSRRTQKVLSPQVCLHCKDPECLTGCPTGAIFRAPGGDVDIHPETCIGCFDCATQCPYDAISMVPREPRPIPTPNLLTRLRGALSLSLPKPPPSEEQTDDMVAIKCNLCDNTPLNPTGRSVAKYSCEENCPTGALVRVNPLEYFSETGETLGLIMRDQTHAIGRNIHKSDPLARVWHIGGGLLIVALTVLVIVGLQRHGFNGVVTGTWLTMRWVTGLTGLVAVAAVMTYPLRKQIYRRRAGALRYWLIAHSYAGALAGIILLLHAGKHTGGAITTALYLTFILTIVTGLVGIAMYLVVPRIMTGIEGDPLLVEDLVHRRNELRGALDKIINRTNDWLHEEITRGICKRFSSKRFLLRQFSHRTSLQNLLAESRQLLKERTTRVMSDEERALLLEALETTVTLRRLDALIYLHQSLKLWIAPHVISTSLMLVLMIAHIVQAVFFSVNH